MRCTVAARWSVTAVRGSGLANWPAGQLWNETSLALQSGGDACRESSAARHESTDVSRQGTDAIRFIFVFEMLLRPGIQQRQQMEQMDQPTLGYVEQSGSLYDNDPEMLKVALLAEKRWIAVAVVPEFTTSRVSSTICISIDEFCLPKRKSSIRSNGSTYHLFPRSSECPGRR